MPNLSFGSSGPQVRQLQEFLNRLPTNLPFLAADGQLAGLSTNLRQIQGSTTTDAQYQRALVQFRRRPDPPGQVLNWVCRDNSYLDLTQNRLEMDPD